MPVLQGYTVEDYLRCWDMYAAAGVDLAQYPVVGVGLVCRRQDTAEIGEVMAALRGRDAGLPIHGFGVKSEGIARYGDLLDTSDWLAWSKYARHDGVPMPGCEGAGHKNCANCSRYALAWRATAPGRLPDERPRLGRRRGPHRRHRPLPVRASTATIPAPASTTSAIRKTERRHHRKKTNPATYQRSSLLHTAGQDCCLPPHVPAFLSY